MVVAAVKPDQVALVAVVVAPDQVVLEAREVVVSTVQQDSLVVMKVMAHIVSTAAVQ